VCLSLSTPIRISWPFSSPFFFSFYPPPHSCAVVGGVIRIHSLLYPPSCQSLTLIDPIHFARNPPHHPLLFNPPSSSPLGYYVCSVHPSTAAFQLSIGFRLCLGPIDPKLLNRDTHSSCPSISPPPPTLFSCWSNRERKILERIFFFFFSLVGGLVGHFNSWPFGCLGTIWNCGPWRDRCDPD
jgi:hypothetical protein